MRNLLKYLTIGLAMTFFVAPAAKASTGELEIQAALCLAGSEYLGKHFPSDKWKSEIAHRTVQLQEIVPNASKREESLSRMREAFSKKSLKRAIKARDAKISVEEAGKASAQIARNQCYHLDVYEAKKSRN